MNKIWLIILIPQLIFQGMFAMKNTILRRNPPDQIENTMINQIDFIPFFNQMVRFRNPFFYVLILDRLFMRFKKNIQAGIPIRVGVVISGKFNSSRDRLE